ncbi:hypothetical protein GCM10011317_15970 [Niveispirillum cyanobacteriorum]|nr:hypothetical protein GCM10011317_15970 [Niveispirillum cyanobacteriorum]
MKGMCDTCHTLSGHATLKHHGENKAKTPAGGVSGGGLTQVSESESRGVAYADKATGAVFSRLVISLFSAWT